MANLSFRLSAMGVFCAATYFIFRGDFEESPIIVMSTLTMLNDDELQKLPGQAMSGNCGASIRLGDYYMTQMSNTDEAEKWYRMADSCSKDPRVKEFLITCIIDNNEKDSSVADVTRLFYEIDVIDPVRAERMRESVDAFLNQGSKGGPKP